MSGQEIKGHLDLLLLAVLADGPGHGYAVVSELRSRSDEVFDLPEGTVYPALHRLESQGLIQSDWKVVESRRRRVYSLTRAGRRRLGERSEAWTRFAAGVESVLGGSGA